MCQLTFLNFKNKKMNSLYLYNQWMINTSTMHRDGCGFYSNHKLHKTHFGANVIGNYGTWFNNITLGPVIAHVRQATAVKGVKTVSDESSHPFESEKLVLAHNGSLEYKDTKTHNEKTESVDTILFLNELTQEYAGQNFVEALKNTVEKFYGTFAFLIYSKLEDKYFVARSDSKKLYKTRITATKSGELVDTSIILNTDEKDLTNAVFSFANLAGIGFQGCKIEWDKIEEVEKNSIFEIDIDKDLMTKVGDVKETTKPFSQPESYYSKQKPYTYPETSGSKIVSLLPLKVEESTIKFLDDFALSIQELDYMVYIAKGHGLFYATPTELQDVVDFSTTVLSNFLTEEKVKIWSEITAPYGNPIIIYEIYHKLQFPYHVNGEKMLMNILEKERRE